MFEENSRLRALPNQSINTMNKILFTIAFAIISIPSIAQIKGSWDASSYTYSYPVNGIKWTLPSEFNWESNSFNDPGLVFKASDLENGVMVMVSILDDQDYGYEDEAWNMFEQMDSPEYKLSIEQAAIESGTTIKTLNNTKSLISGHKAVKTITFSSRYEENCGRVMENYDVSCIMIHNHIYYSFSIRIVSAEESEDQLEKIVNHILNGLSIK